MQIGVIGIRGHKAIYSGFETFITFLVKLSKNNYYYLFSRKSYCSTGKLGTNYIEYSIPVVNGKYIETPFYALFSTLLSLSKPIHTMLYLSIANCISLPLQKIFRRKIIVNVDGFDWKRKRWNIFGKLYLKFCEKMVILFADLIVADSKEVMLYYKNKYQNKKVIFIPYGAKIHKRKPGGVLKKLGLRSRKYIHWIGRLTPENSVEDLIIAFKDIKDDIKCVIVGDSVYEEKYKQYLRKIARIDKRIIFTGFLNRHSYEIVSTNSLLYVETKEIGGIHPSLLEAMASGIPVIAKKLPSHMQVLQKNGIYYTNISELQNKINKILSNFTKSQTIGIENKRNVIQNYQWNQVVKQYEKLFVH